MVAWFELWSGNFYNLQLVFKMTIKSRLIMGWWALIGDIIGFGRLSIRIKILFETIENNLRIHIYKFCLTWKRSQMISNWWRIMVMHGKVWCVYLKIISFRNIPKLFNLFIKEIQSMGEMEPEFDNETLNLTGKTLRFIMKKTANFGVNNYIRF